MIDLLPVLGFLRNIAKAVTLLPGKLQYFLRILKEKVWPGGCPPAAEGTHQVGTEPAGRGLSATELPDKRGKKPVCLPTVPSTEPITGASSNSRRSSVTNKAGAKKRRRKKKSAAKAAPAPAAR